MSTERETKTVVAADLDLDYLEDRHHLPLADFISRMQAVLDGIPVEYRETATFNISASGDYAHAHADVTYQRPETDEEIAALGSKCTN